MRNAGPTIPENLLPFLFDPFYRGDMSRKSAGFGLGLASVKSVIESHGWSISVKSENRETEVRIVIPEELTQNEAS